VRRLIAVIVATAALSSTTTAVVVQLATPRDAEAQGSEVSVLRQINRKLTTLNDTVGTTNVEGLRGELHRLRTGQVDFCRAIAQEGALCPSRVP
jgi:hypothetical protein